MLVERDELGEAHQLRAQLALRTTLVSLALQEVPGCEDGEFVDDIVTTGSTVSEITRILHRAGVEYVEVWGLARAYRR